MPATANLKNGRPTATDGFGMNDGECLEGRLTPTFGIPPSYFDGVHLLAAPSRRHG